MDCSRCTAPAQVGGLSRWLDDLPDDDDLPPDGNRLADDAAKITESMTMADEKTARERAIERMTEPGIFYSGDEVLYDGEAEHLGVPPLTKVPPMLPPIPGGIYDDDEDVYFGTQPGPRCRSCSHC
jgi:hypothetical protein